jgi:regulator of cell morphogenesis and NO signaling
LPRLDGLLAKVQKAHSSMHSDMLGQLRHAYDSLRTELEAHLMKEEQILFPLIKETEAFVHGGGAKPVSHCGSVANPIRQMEREHDDAGNELAIMRKLTGGYQLPIDACQTFAALYEGLAAMEADLHEHIHLENNILFPKSIEREAQMAG